MVSVSFYVKCPTQRNHGNLMDIEIRHDDIVTSKDPGERVFSPCIYAAALGIYTHVKRVGPSLHYITCTFKRKHLDIFMTRCVTNMMHIVKCLILNLPRFHFGGWGCLTAAEGQRCFDGKAAWPSRWALGHFSGVVDSGVD